MKHKFESWLKQVKTEIRKSRKHQDLVIPEEVAREVYSWDCPVVAGATLILRRLKPESNLENCKYLKPAFKVGFGELV